MRKITKRSEPQSLTDWKRSNPGGGYQGLRQEPEVRRSIRQSCLEDQYSLCAYCCVRLRDADDCHNDHIECQHTYPSKSLDYSNIVASCQGGNRSSHCGHHKKSDWLPLTPLMQECETEISFDLYGNAGGNTERAKETIRVLNLGSLDFPNPGLKQRRKDVIDAVLFEWELVDGMGIPTTAVEDPLVADLIRYLESPVNGTLESYAPIVVRILRDWLKN